ADRRKPETSAGPRAALRSSYRAAEWHERGFLAVCERSRRRRLAGRDPIRDNPTPPSTWRATCSRREGAAVTPRSFGIEATTDEDRAYAGSRFADVREALFAHPYQSTWA